MRELILASNSPRRRQLMAEAGYTFRAINTDFDETIPSGLEPHKVAAYLAKSKNDHYRDQFEDEILITADTIVVKDQHILGKPANREEAMRMLRELSGSAHLVISGFCISDQTKIHASYDTTQVYFDQLSEEEIAHYIRKDKPYDKAGAYGIQDWIGLTRIQKIEGSYFNVMGLPVNMVYQMLKDQYGITPFNH